MPFFDLDDTRLYYETTGTGAPLLFIHGLGSSTRDWYAQVDYFADDYRVITADLRGHGRSESSATYSIPRFADDMAALLQHLEAAPANIVGLSLGGMVAFQLAVEHPTLVRRLVIANSRPEVKLESLRDYWRYGSRRLVAQVLGMRTTGRILAHRLFHKPEHGRLRQAFIERWAENDKSAYLQTLDAIVGWSVADRIASISCPTLIIAAEEDYTSFQKNREYANRIPDARLVVIPDARHATPVEEPEAFNETIASFLHPTAPALTSEAE